MRIRTCAICVLAGLGAAAPVSGAAANQGAGQPPVLREGSGQRRASMDAMELAPFPAEAWGTLSDWVGGRSLSSVQTAGSVVLICTYSDWYDPARRAWGVARRMASSKGKDGLIVVGAHHPEEWTAAAKDVPKDGNVYLAHDARGAFRGALLADQDPDFYIIDRAGQLRFADVETESVERAVNQLLAESADQASGLKARLAADAEAADAAFRRSGAIRERIDLKSLPEIPFADPPKTAYEAATWPRRPVDADRSRQDEPPTTIQLPQGGAYFPRPPALKGRAIAIYLFNADVVSSYDSLMPLMDRLQDKHGRDAAIIGAAAFTAQDQYSAPQIDAREAVRRVTNIATSRTVSHSLTLYTDGMMGSGVENRSNENVALAVIASSDGVVRWSGRPTSPGFQAALEQVIAADPGVKARRAAEDAYIKAKGN